MKRRSSIAVVLPLSLQVAGCLGGGKEYSLSGVLQDGLGIPVADLELIL